MRFYGTIQKVDKEQRMVFGYASTEAVDAHGETVLKTAIEGALDDYLDYANLREMHQLSAVGVTKEAAIDDKGLYISAKVVDDAAWKKVTEGVYKGFSIGGKVLGRDDIDRKVITKIRLDEISLVDRPSNPEARFDVWKAAGSPQEDVSMAKAKTAELPLVDKPADDAEALAKVGAWLTDMKAAVEESNDNAEAVGYFAKRDFNAKERKKDAKDGAAMKDGSFPIENETDLKNAIKLAGHAKDPAAARAHIKKRAKALGLEDLIPDTWKAADSAPITAQEDADPLDKANEAAAVAEESAGEEKPADLAKVDAEPEAVDPVAKATAALKAADDKIAAIAEAETQKGLGSVANFADIMTSLGWLAQDAELEAEYEADNSPVPAKLREWIKAGAAIFKDMAKEEIDELVAAGKVKKAAAGGDLAKATDQPWITLPDGRSLTLAEIEAMRPDDLAKVTTERDDLQKALTDKDEALAKLADHVTATIGRMNETIDSLSKRLDAYGQQPVPAKTAGPFAVSKEEDSPGNAALQKGEPTADDLQKALAEMAPEDRALLLTKAALALPRQAHFIPAR